jgi:type I site-specific restriction endonuclease
MFNRWLQENDFKYLNKHFGINQLTSYRSTPYEQLRDELTDRQVPNRAYLEKVRTGRQLAGRQARQLLAADRAQRAQAQRQQRLEEIEATIASRAAAGVHTPPATAAESKQIARLGNAARRHEHYRRERATKIEALHQLILRNEEEKSALEKEVSRIDQLINQKMVRMDLANKTLMDAIKITARNLFYRLFAPFKAAYDNYRDDHDHFRKLTQCDGVLRWSGTEVEAHLVPQVSYPPKLRRIIQARLDQINAGGLVLPDGSGRPLRLCLTRKEQISVRVNDIP